MRVWEKGRMRSLSETILKDPIKCLTVPLCSRWESQASVASSSLQSTSTLTPELVRIQDLKTSCKGRMVYWQCRVISRR